MHMLEIENPAQYADAKDFIAKRLAENKKEVFQVIKMIQDEKEPEMFYSYLSALREGPDADSRKYRGAISLVLESALIAGFRSISLEAAYEILIEREQAKTPKGLLVIIYQVITEAKARQDELAKNSSKH